MCVQICLNVLYVNTKWEQWACCSSITDLQYMNTYIKYCVGVKKSTWFEHVEHAKLIKLHNAY